MYLLAVLLGVVIGLSLGALGGGGSILTVPALVYVLGQNAHGATTASLVIVGVTALAGATAHARAGRARTASGLLFGGLGIAGSFVGARLSSGVSSDVLLTAFAGLVLVAAAAMALRTARTAEAGGTDGRRTAGAMVDSAYAVAGRAPGETKPAVGAPNIVQVAGQPLAVGSGRNLPTQWSSVSRLVLAATGVGLLTGFFGVGGGFILVPALVLVLGFEMPVAVGTSLVVIAVNSAAALIARIGTQVQVDWPLVAAFVAAAVLGSLFGHRVLAIARPQQLALAFTVLLVGVAIYTATRSVPHLM
jgi:uncharacterized protein